MLSIVYIVLWGILALYCFVSAHKIGNLLYLAGAFFLFLFGWNLANYLLTVDLFDGVYNIVFRCVAAGFLLLLVLGYVKIRKNNHK
jgi:hypothetical protein